MGTATTKDVTGIKKRVNQIITAQARQQETLVHIVSILNFTRYTTQINRQHINIVIDAVDRMEQDVQTLYNITNSLYTSLSYHQLVLHIRSILANLRDSLPYIRTVSMHTMDYVDAATTGILWPHILLIEDLRLMLSYIEDTTFNHVPTGLIWGHATFLPIFTYPCSDCQQFLLLIDVPIQDHTQQLALHEVFTLDIPHGNFSLCYDINTKYLEITQDENMAVEISEHQFCICRDVTGQFCNIDTPLQPLANPPSCITGLYAKNTASINMRCSFQIRNTNSISIPTSIAPNVWILTSASSAVTTRIALICPKVATRSIILWKPIHILHLPPACSATSPHFIYHHAMRLRH